MQSSTPTSEGLTALSSYVLACLLFVFSAKLEFAFVLFVKRNYSRNEKKALRIEQQKQQQQRPSSVTASEQLSFDSKEGKWNLEEIENKEGKKKKKDLKMGCCSVFDRITDVDEFCYKTDKIAFCIFALAFCLYNVIYIIVYAT